MIFKKNWKYLDRYALSLPDVTWIHCDTKDFHLKCCNGRKKLAQTYKKMAWKMRDADLFTLDEIYPYLKTLEANSGGPTETLRLLSFQRDPSLIRCISFCKVKEAPARYIAYYIGGLNKLDKNDIHHPSQALNDLTR